MFFLLLPVMDLPLTSLLILLWPLNLCSLLLTRSSSSLSLFSGQTYESEGVNPDERQHGVVPCETRTAPLPIKNNRSVIVIYVSDVMLLLFHWWT